MLIPENFEQIIYDYLFDKLFVTQFKKSTMNLLVEIIQRKKELYHLNTYLMNN